LANASNALQTDAIVSSDSDQLILVNHLDEEIGHLSKGETHDGAGLLHRAFSLFVFNDEGDLLLQQRAGDKRLWPMYWANSCCSHPRHGETMDEAVHRRLHEELGVTSNLQYMYKFVYHASFGDAGSEYEYCWVYIGKTTDKVQANTTELADWRFIKPEQLDHDLLHDSQHYTPWLKSEWARLRSEFNEQINTL